MSRFKATAAGIAFLLALCVPAFGQTSATAPAPGPGGPGMWGHRGMERGFDGLFLNKLGLSEEQTAQISQIHANHKTAIQNLMSQIQTKRQALEQAQQGTNFDETVATPILQEIVPLEANLMAEHFRMHQEIQAVLTPAQKATQAQLKAQFQQKMQQRMQEMRARHQHQAAPASSL